MRIEGWHVMLLLVMVVVAVGVIVAVTLIVRWTLRLTARRHRPGGD
jgi:nitrogen fixation protein FixH